MKNSTHKLAFVSGLLLWASYSQAQTPAVYQTVSIIGSATAAGWGADTPMRLASPGDVHNWIIGLPLFGGPGNSEVKFRADNSWQVNWGAASFPTGTGTANGPNIPIPVPAGASSLYNVQFNDITGAYRFTIIPLASKAGSGPALAPTLYPNPARHTATLTGALPGTVAQVFDALGRPVFSATADATGTAALALPAGLPAGVYVVRAGNTRLRLAVE
ncbi:T9SS type A sorting domain-containing protein [Microvirga sp. STS02]|uniref:T9SS type A sorting domain-containing protein n=1 Tax=Hymenobacter negativus TaxID=2795026 RepID=UPI0018DB36F1|nr:MULTISPECIES: T9SS type A sorting domain-containing protein [Bacteria]MBH8567325.1 T9SS type A sorting domain-containing protein [Hymenobacter negativus]MBR7207057.1 T9SS type A sorting domain-containing protein [Microvirga sp. STS02]